MENPPSVTELVAGYRNLTTMRESIAAVVSIVKSVIDIYHDSEDVTFPIDERSMWKIEKNESLPQMDILFITEDGELYRSEGDDPEDPIDADVEEVYDALTHLIEKLLAHTPKAIGIFNEYTKASKKVL